MGIDIRVSEIVFAQISLECGKICDIIKYIIESSVELFRIWRGENGT